MYQRRRFEGEKRSRGGDEINWIGCNGLSEKDLFI